MPPDALEPRRYRAFISYTHRDEKVVSWLHHALETYRLPAKLVGKHTSVGVVPQRLTPIFRDRDELPARADLGAAITAALQNSLFLVVVCSPAAAASKWVNEEIRAFKQHHGEDRVLAVIIGGEPFASDRRFAAGDSALSLADGAAQECFPLALRYRVGADGELTRARAEPIAADLRADGDGRSRVRLKLVAGLTGLELDDLVQREAQRRVRRGAMITSGALMGMLVAGGLAVYANVQRLAAEREAATARAASEFLIGTFLLSNPATQNPKTITALSILDQSAERARVELADQPVVQARLVSTLGQAFINLGLFEQARTAIERSSAAITRAGPDGADAALTLATTHIKMGAPQQAMSSVRRAERLLGETDRPQDRARAAVIEGTIHTAAADVKAGLAAYDRALLIYRTHPEFGARNHASTLLLRANLLSDDRQFSAAESALLESLAITRKTLGDAHILTGQCWYALAQNAFLAGQLTLAEQRIAKALFIERPLLDGNNAIVADLFSLQGQIYQAQKRLLPAQHALQRAIAIYRGAFGRPHYLIGIAQVYLALVQSERGQPEVALQTLADAKRNYDASYGKQHANHGDLLVHRATILARAGRRAEALADCASGLAILHATLGPQSAYAMSMQQTCKAL